MADKQEMFDIVNDDDEVVGSAPRSRAHLEGLLHRAVYCWIFDGAGSLLLQRRSAAKKIGASQWDLSVAEHLTPGESYAQVRGQGRGWEKEKRERCVRCVKTFVNRAHSLDGLISSVYRSGSLPYWTALILRTFCWSWHVALSTEAWWVRIGGAMSRSRDAFRSPS